MPLHDPPSVGVLAAVQKRRTAGLRLHRVVRASRAADPWFFAGIPAGTDPYDHGRFDLPMPHGACDVAVSPVAAVLETLQHLVGAAVPDSELRNRVRVEVVAPTDSPPAADLTAARSRGAGIHAALWADHDRATTQQWADQFYRAGHRALYHGIQHDPTGRLRAVTLFDKAGKHPPYGDTGGWEVSRHALHTDPALRTALARYGLTVTLDPSLRIVTPQDSGHL